MVGLFREVAGEAPAPTADDEEADPPPVGVEPLLEDDDVFMMELVEAAAATAGVLRVASFTSLNFSMN